MFFKSNFFRHTPMSPKEHLLFVNPSCIKGGKGFVRTYLQSTIRASRIDAEADF